MLVAVAATGGCDTLVVNPGPIQDSSIDDPDAHQALLNGSARAYALALTDYAMIGGAVALEIIGAGNIGTHGIAPNVDAGLLRPDIGRGGGQQWDWANRARWTAEEAVNRMRGSIGEEFRTYEIGTETLLWAGFANRMLGENACAAIFDGGPAEPRSRYFERAEALFSEAMANAQVQNNARLQHAALVGRAAARAWLNDWQGAASDAALVPPGFRFQAKYYATGIAADGELNRLAYAVEGNPFRTYTVAGTFFETYYQLTDDNRTPWTTDPRFERGTRGDPPPLFYVQLKYDSRESPINVATGREALLIVAEHYLRQGDVLEAITVLNRLRADAGLPAIEADTLESAWTALRQERAVEFWLEARTLGDIWRFESDNVPGSHPWGGLEGRDRCFPFSQAEINTNPNISGPYG
jgi:starch-binding outer membrane protein, SusD/RagB family